MHKRLTHQEAAEARAIAEAVARQVRDAVADEINRPGAGDITGIASSGDTTFSMDNAAEAALEAAIAGLGTPVACYSEDQGLQVPDGGARWLLVVDPIAVSYTHLRAHETPEHLVCRLLLEKTKKHKLQLHHTYQNTHKKPTQ